MEPFVGSMWRLELGGSGERRVEDDRPKESADEHDARHAKQNPGDMR
jgi:hypothetical protein